MKIFVIDFSGSNYLAEYFDKNHDVFVENLDGGTAYKQIGQIMPDKIFINYKDKPSHGRQTGVAIKRRKKTSSIPIYFVDGNKEENEKIKSIGRVIETKDIENCIIN